MPSNLLVQKGIAFKKIEGNFKFITLGVVLSNNYPEYLGRQCPVYLSVCIPLYYVLIYSLFKICLLYDFS